MKRIGIAFLIFCSLSSSCGKRAYDKYHGMKDVDCPATTNVIAMEDKKTSNIKLFPVLSSLDTHQPTRSKILQLMISDENGWYLNIRDDGSAQFGFGSSDMEALDVGTFAFAEIRRSLVDAAKTDASDEYIFQVSGASGDDSCATTFGFVPRRTVMPLFDKARQLAPEMNPLWEMNRGAGVRIDPLRVRPKG